MSTHKSVHFRMYTLNVKSEIQTYNAYYDLALLKQQKRKTVCPWWGDRHKCSPSSNYYYSGQDN